MGRVKIEIKKIEDKQKRHVTFSKRRPNLFGKAARLCKLTDAEIAIIVFSSSGKLFAFGHPSVDQVVERYNNGEITATTTGDSVSDGNGEITTASTTGDSVSGDDYSEELCKIENHLSWENIELENCSLAELEKMEKSLDQLGLNVHSRLSLLPVNENGNGNNHGNVVVDENGGCSSYYSGDDIVQEYLRQDICDQLPPYA